MQDPNNFEAYDPGGISANTAASPSQFTPRDALAGHLAEPQRTLESAADGLTTLGYRRPDYAATLALLSGHSFMEEIDGDGHHEPETWWYSCSCTKVIYARWTQTDPDMTGLNEFRDGGREDAMSLHHAHVAAILTGTGPEDVPKPEFYPLITEDSIVAAANQLRSQLGDFTSPDVLMRKRAKFVLRAAIPYLGVEQAR